VFPPSQNRTGGPPAISLSRPAPHGRDPDGGDRRLRRCDQPHSKSHTPGPQVTKIYNRFDYEPQKREALG